MNTENLWTMMNRTWSKFLNQREKHMQEVSALNTSHKNDDITGKRMNELIFGKEEVMQKEADFLKKLYVETHNRALLQIEEPRKLSRKKVDEDVMFLLNNIDLTASEFENICKSQSENITMKRILQKYAKDNDYKLPSPSILDTGETAYVESVRELAQIFGHYQNAIASWNDANKWDRLKKVVSFTEPSENIQDIEHNHNFKVD